MAQSFQSVLFTAVPRRNLQGALRIKMESTSGLLSSWHKDEHIERAVKGLYILAGPQGSRGEGRKGFTRTIAGGKVTVPSREGRFWKVKGTLPRPASRSFRQTIVSP